MPNNFADPLTPKQDAFAKAFGKELLNYTDAARQAGYSDPNAEIKRLLAQPAVIAKIIEYLRASAVKWAVLVAKAKSTLLSAMDENLRLKDGTPTDQPNMRVRLEAARVVLLTLKRDGAGLLEDTAGAEDAAAESNIDLARRIVGSRVAEPPTEQ
jgi:hypothetical protein